MEEYQILGVEENQNNIYGMDIYPNPTSQEITIVATFTKNEKIKILITDMLGKTIISLKESIASGKYSKKIDMKGLSGGVYFVTLSTDEGLAVRNVVKK